MTTMQPAVGTARRQAGAAQRQPMGRAASGAQGRKASRTSGRLKNAPATTERRAVMIRHTVEILSNYDGLCGVYGTVVRGDTGDGKVLVEVRWPTDTPRQICYLSREVEHVAMDDAILHNATEECLLIHRHLRLTCCIDYMPVLQEFSGHMAEAVKRRQTRLQAQIRMIQRAESSRPGNPRCTALVLWEGGAR